MSDEPTARGGEPGAGSQDKLPAPCSVLTTQVRWGVYLILIAIAVGNMSGRLLSVNSVDKVQLETARLKDRLAAERQQLADQGVTGSQLDDRMAAEEKRLGDALQLQRPFLSANDRSRWLTIRALVERGTYEIDDLVVQPNWDTIDMVKHVGRDGQSHLYSSKPPLLATLLAGEYWLIHQFSGATLADRPYEIGRFMLFTINILPLALMYVLLAKMVERFGTTDWGRIFVVAAATLGTFLNTFAVVLNNHTIAAVSAAVALYAAVRIMADGERRLGYFALAGLAAAFTAADELPALTLVGVIGLMLLYRAPRETLLAFVPGMAVVVAAFFATDLIANNSLAAAVHAPQRHEPERKLVQLFVHGERPRNTKLLAQSAGHRSGRAEQVEVRISRAHRSPRSVFIDADLAAEHCRLVHVARLAG